jgi:hypothetical protein
MSSGRDDSPLQTTYRENAVSRIIDILKARKGFSDWWNDLYEDDGRRLHPVDQTRPFGGVTEGIDWDGAIFEKPETWRWRVPK